MLYCRDLLIITLLFSFCSADGIKRDSSGRIIEKVIKIAIDENQKDEIELLKTLTLTQKQLDHFEKAGIVLPKRFIEILDNNYSDCTCESSRFVLKYSRDTVLAVFSKMNNLAAKEMRQVLLSGDARLTIAVTAQGNYFIHSIKTDISTIIKAVTETKVLFFKERASRKLFIEIDGNTVRSKTKNELILLKRVCKENGIEVVEIRI